MIVVFLTVILAPVLMLVLTFWGINRIQIESLRQSYGITDTEGLIASAYFQMFSHSLCVTVRRRFWMGMWPA